MKWERVAAVGWTILAVAGALPGSARRASAQTMDRRLTVFALADQLEYAPGRAGRRAWWDLAGWIGDSYSRVWIKTEGEWQFGGSGTEFDVRAEYSRLIRPYWDAQAGVRMDVNRSAGRTHTRAQVAVSLLGYTPYRFQLEPELYISQDGQVLARLTAELDLFLTQRFIAQPRFETFAAFSENQTFGVGSGFNYVEPGLRVRYEIRREFAPYVGLDWLRRLGGTARLAQAAGEARSQLALVVGLRLWH